MIQLKRFPIDDGTTIDYTNIRARELGVIGFILLAFAMVSEMDFQDQQRLLAKQQALACADVGALNDQ